VAKGGNAKVLEEIMLSDKHTGPMAMQPWLGKGYLPGLYIDAYTNIHGPIVPCSPNIKDYASGGFHFCFSHQSEKDSPTRTDTHTNIASSILHPSLVNISLVPGNVLNSNLLASNCQLSAKV